MTKCRTLVPLILFITALTLSGCDKGESDPRSEFWPPLNDERPLPFREREVEYHARQAEKFCGLQEDSNRLSVPFKAKNRGPVYIGPVTCLNKYGPSDCLLEYQKEKKYIFSINTSDCE
jgi:hypothetical protein